MPMSEQYEEMETVEATEVEEVDEPVNELEPDAETEQDSQEEESQEPDYSQADKDFLDRFEITFDKNSKKFESLEQLREAAEMGSALPRYKEKVSKYESNAAYKYIDGYMKKAGYTDPVTFVNDIKINEKTKEFVDKGMSEEDARASATEIIKNESANNDGRTKEIDGFLKWHSSKVDEGKFTGPLDANNIPQSVIDAYENGQPLKEAYMDFVLDDIKVKTEQQTIKKIKKNKETSGGELKNGKPDNTKSMTPTQIEKLLSGMSPSEQSKWVDANYAVIEKSGYYD